MSRAPFGLPIGRLALRPLLLAGAPRCGILVDEMPPARDGDAGKDRPLERVEPAEPVATERTSCLPPRRRGTARNEQQDREVEQHGPRREPALHHGRIVGPGLRIMSVQRRGRWTWPDRRVAATARVPSRRRRA